MVVIQLAGGLGNQMFQYALYWQLRSLGKDVKIDDVTGFEADLQREPELDIYGVTYERPTQKELRKMLDSEPDLFHKVRRKLAGRNKRAYFEEDKRFKPEIFGWDDIYLEGYWQSEKYFEKVSGELRRIYDTDRLLEKLGEQNNPFLEQITGTESVSVHIRRGDYLTPENEKLFGGICTESYYGKAMAEMEKRHPGCRYFVFTNDKEGTNRFLKNVYAEIPADRITMVDIPAGEHADCLEFALMSKCRHNILANSSFSWWASYLNKNGDKTVLVPERWLNGWDCSDFYRTDMQKIGQ